MKHRWNATFCWSLLLSLPLLLVWANSQAHGMDSWFRSQFQTEILNGRICLTTTIKFLGGNRKMENRSNGQHILRQMTANQDGTVQLEYMLNDRKTHVEFKYTPKAITYLQIDKLQKTYAKFAQLEGAAIRTETGEITSSLQDGETWLTSSEAIEVSYTEKSTPDAVECSASTLWESVLFASEGTHRVLDAVFSICSDDLTVSSLQQQFLQSLIRIASLDETLPEESWCLEQIAKLGDDQFAVRQAADRELRKVGPLLQAVVDKLDQQTLDAEQRMRLHRMLGDVKSLHGDEALDYTVRAWRTDPRVWFVLLTSPEATPRSEELAVVQLRQLLGERFTWDPQADEATRKQNLETLRTQVGLQQAVPSGPSDEQKGE